ncbi:helix-turn-helix transcriptional regulator [Actinokineospora auranticolor]|uniref:Transcriptional regulator with XRE-family HTH domain n=1 Tax=Actinokineospora auranticolor TaxID=155976 RepID=A0A2S6GZD0_9PSEU|nr:helix-turn-helix transcriptional regulator [Actinokineospora auranticolor]PPK70594.1 transcriptional regulator with XRE-family HTH domain [Actinokineospora auranticolor]
MGTNSPKSFALGRVIRRARTQKRFSLKDLSRIIGRDTATMCRWEIGERIPALDQLTYILGVLGVRGQALHYATGLARDPDNTSWLTTDPHDRLAQHDAYIDFEQRAREATIVSPMLVPDLLHTPATAEAIAAAGGNRVTHRERSRILSGAQPVNLRVFLGAPALNQHIGGTATAHEQLEHLAVVSRLPTVELRVFGLGLGWHPGVDGSFSVLNAHNLRTAYVTGRQCSVWLHRSEDVERYEQDCRAIEERALSPEESLALISETARRLR